MKKVLLLLLMVLVSFLEGEYIPKNDAIKMLQRVDAKDFPKSDAVHIRNEITTLDVHCLGSTMTEHYRKILNDNARKDNSVRFWYNTHYHNVKVDAIERIKPDGTIVPFDPDKLLKEKDDTFSGSANIYSKLSKVLTGELPDVQIGDIIYTRQTLQIKKAAMENQYFDSFGIEDYSPFLNKYKEVSLPGDVTLYIHDLNNKGLTYQHSTQERGNDIIYKWNVSNVPIIVYEPHIELYNLFAHHFKWTTVKTWEDISRWYYHLVKPHMKTNEAIRATVSELIKGAKTRKEKVSRIFYWVANHIRYLGVDGEKYRPGLEPHDVTYTFETRGGVCRDKSALLTAMFRLAGVKSDVILISSGSRLNVEAPVLGFNHAISVSYDEKGEPEYIFDPTDENTKDFLPEYEEDNSYLIASQEGDTLRITPVSPPSKNNSTLNIDLKIDDAGAASGEIELLFSGFADTVFRGYLARLSPYEVENSISRIIYLLHPNAWLIDFFCTDPHDKKTDLKIRAAVEIENYASLTNNMVFIPFDAANLNMHLLYDYIMDPFNLSARKYDFKMAGVFSLDTHYEIEFPMDLISPSIPNIKTFDFEGFKTTFKSTSEGNKLRVHYHFETSRIHFKQERFLPIKAKISDFLKNDHLYIIGKPGGHSE